MTAPDTALPGEVLALDDTSFEAMLVEQLEPHRRKKSVWEALLAPAVLLRTQETLAVLHLRMEEVIGEKSMELEVFRAQCDRLGAAGKRVWDDGRVARMISHQESTRFLTLVKSAQIQVQHRMARAGVEPGRVIRRAIPALQALVAQIVAHEDEMADDPSQADEDLWDQLDEIRVIINRKWLTLREAHETIWSKDDEEESAQS